MRREQFDKGSPVSEASHRGELRSFCSSVALKEAGYTAGDLKDVYSLQKLIKAGFTARELKECYSLAQLGSRFRGRASTRTVFCVFS